MPKRRSIFRTTGTASTPDLSTLIRGKKSQAKQQPVISRQMSGSSKHSSLAPGQNPNASTSTTAIATHLTSPHTSSTSSLGASNSRRREGSQLQQPRGSGQDWDRLSSHSNMTSHHYPDSQRQMPPISEGPNTEPLGRHTSADETTKVSLLLLEMRVVKITANS